MSEQFSWAEFFEAFIKFSINVSLPMGAAIILSVFLIYWLTSWSVRIWARWKIKKYLESDCNIRINEYEIGKFGQSTAFGIFAFVGCVLYITFGYIAIWQNGNTDFAIIFVAITGLIGFIAASIVQLSIAYSIWNNSILPSINFRSSYGKKVIADRPKLWHKK